MTRFLSPPEVARQLGTTPERVRGWCAAGELVAFRPPGGKHWRISETEVEAFIARNSSRQLPKPVRKQREAVSSSAEFFSKWGA